MKYTDNDLKIYSQGVIEGKKHTEPSPETKNMFNRIIQAMEKLSEKVEKIALKLNTNDSETKHTTEELRSHIENEKDFLKEINEKLDSLLSLKIFYTAVMIFLGIIGWILAEQYQSHSEIAVLQSDIKRIDNYFVKDNEND